MTNAQDSLTVEVTQEDIDQGECGVPTNCPIARAIRRVTKHEYVSVGSWSAGVGPLIVNLPYDAIRFVEEFDSRHTVKPFRFELTGAYSIA